MLQAALAQARPPIPVTHQMITAVDGTPIHLYDFPEDLPRVLRNWAYRQARAALRCDFPDAESKYSIGVRSIGYVLHLTPLPECTCGRDQAPSAQSGVAPPWLPQSIARA